MYASIWNQAEAITIARFLREQGEPYLPPLFLLSLAAHSLNSNVGTIAAPPLSPSLTCEQPRRTNPVILASHLRHIPTLYVTKSVGSTIISSILKEKKEKLSRNDT